MFRRLLPFWRPAWRGTVAGAALLLLGVVFDLANPWPMQWLFDYTFGSRTPPAWLAAIFPAFARHSRGDQARGIIIVCLSMALIALASKGLATLSSLLLIRSGAKLVQALRCQTSEHLHRLSLTFHDRHKVGDSLYRVAYDTQAAQSFLNGAVVPLITGVATFLGILAVTLRINWRLTLTALAIAPVFLILIRLFTRAIDRRARSYHENESSLYALMSETLSSIRAVQAFTREPQSDARFRAHAGLSTRLNLRLITVQVLFGMSVGVAMALGSAAVVFVAANLVLQQRLSVGVLLIFPAYVGMLYNPMNAISQSFGVISSTRAQLRRVFEVLDTSPGVADRPHALAPPRVQGHIEFRNLSFAYEADRPVLQNINLVAEPGQIVAIVGRTGAGKTTLASMILRFYDPTAGAVLLDGHDLRDLRLSWLRRQVSVVLQDAILFSTTIEENIAYGLPHAGPKQVETAARQAQADGFIRALPEGYATVVEERGVNLSGGQRQRIAIARAFLKNAPILVLDEPTSALDAHTEHALVQSVRDLARGRTTFIIAHRLSTVRLANQIVVLDAGRLIEQGSHDQLMQSDTAYRRLYQSQWGDTATTPPIP
jgi:ATP-binding cassette subfamily B protein/subfamily B ATP-binding cassette protein MsbA